MCGIVGIARLSTRELPPPLVLRRMMSTIDYRGPDDSGEMLSADVQLGVVRLAIIDPKGGHQPVSGCVPDRISAVCNGEIYNVHSLRQTLRRAGHISSSQCDTDLLPHLYEEAGVDFVSQVRGMFGFAIWDSAKRRLVLGRDRLGIKPLFYSVTPDYLVFGSEIKAIIASGLIDPEIDPDSLDDLFSMSYPCPPRTMFAGIEEVRPAFTMVVHPGNKEITHSRYWRSPTPVAGEHLRISKNEAAEELRSLLKLRVYDHSMADTPVAAYLSGGLDSSSICGIMKNISGDAPETFSVSFDTPDHDELEYAQEMADFLGAENNVLRCDSDMARDIENMTWHTELPLQFPLALPMIRLAELAKSKGYSVVLTGEGADELMGGYDCFRADKMRRVLDRPGLRFLRPVVYRQLYSWLNMPDGAVEMMLKNQGNSKRVANSYGGILPPWYDVWTTVGIDRKELLGKGGRSVRPVDDAPFGFDKLLPPDFDQLDPFDAAILLEQATRLPSWILLIADRASMAAGVEARVPFLDQDVVEFIARLPPSHKMQGLQEKAVLRRATAGFMPPRLNARKKRPFYTPIRKWFFGADRPDLVEEYMSRQALQDSGIFEPRLVEQYLRSIRTIPSSSLMSNRLEWTLLLVLQTQILHRYFVKERCLKAPSLVSIS